MYSTLNATQDKVFFWKIPRNNSLTLDKETHVLLRPKPLNVLLDFIFYVYALRKEFVFAHKNVTLATRWVFVTLFI